VRILPDLDVRGEAVIERSHLAQVPNRQGCKEPVFGLYVIPQRITGRCDARRDRSDVLRVCKGRP
jgi:hypothetical protein